MKLCVLSQFEYQHDGFGCGELILGEIVLILYAFPLYNVKNA